MFAYIVRSLQSVLVMASVAFVAFALFQYMGDPINQMVAQDATLEQRNALRAVLGLDRPFYVQFLYFPEEPDHRQHDSWSCGCAVGCCPGCCFPLSEQSLLSMVTSRPRLGRHLPSPGWQSLHTRQETLPRRCEKVSSIVIPSMAVC
ncbi:MAG: hypothetical protein V9G19_15630 [Tetrasphaera sp.]